MGGFDDLKKDIEAMDARREKIISKSRDIVRKSKTAIYALQRGDEKDAVASIAEMKKALASLRPYADLEAFAGTIRPAIQEYVEALALLEFVRTGNLLPWKGLGFSAENYLLGLCDLSGEIVRKAMNSAINDDSKTVVAAKKLVEQLYYGMQQLDLRNGELRRKFDGLKYDLKKMEDLVLSMKLQGKI